MCSLGYEPRLFWRKYMDKFEKYSLNLVNEVNNFVVHKSQNQMHTIKQEEYAQALGEYPIGLLDEMKEFDSADMVDLEKYEQWLNEE